MLAVTGDGVLVTTSQPLTAADVNRLRDLYGKDLLTGAWAWGRAHLTPAVTAGG